MIEWIVSSSILILIVAVLRACFKGKLSLRLQYGIWGLVLLRLLIPVSFGSTDFSVENLTDTVQRQPAIQGITEINIPSQSYEAAYEQVVQEYEAAGIDVDSLQGSDLEALEYEVYDRTQGKTVSEIISGILYGIWVAGILVTGTVFAAVNVRFRKKLLASRCELQLEKNHLRVYATDQIDTPCLFGIRKPAIYVTPSVAEEETLLRHTLEHEATHYRHGDHIWAILRCVCLTAHWYNPLVWWAAFLSRQDGELACDEATIQALGEEERAEYGRTLIGMTCQKKSNVLVTATTMAMGKGGLRERIVLIAKKPRMALYTLLIVVVAAAVAVGCTFTGAKEKEPDLTDTQPQIPISSEPTEEAEETKPTETEPPETEPLETVSFEDLVEVPDTLYEQPVHERVCIAVQPTGKVASGEERLYIIPENQGELLRYYLAATDTAHTYTQRDNGDPLTGWWIVFRGEQWQVTESGAMYGWRAQKNVVIDASDARVLYRFCDATVRAAGIGEPVRPNDIGKIKSATLYWNGEHTVTHRYALNKIESWFSNARELTGGAMCWFTAQLVLEMENGETKTVAVATDDCAAYMSEGAFYSFGEITYDGIEDNTEFYSLFAPDLIREKSKEGMDAVKPYLRYLNWGRYSNQFNDPREIFALMQMIEDWAAEEPTFERFGSVIVWSDGLDGAYADAYSGMLCRLYELDPAEFAWACLGNATDEKEANTLFLMAYNWNMSVEEVRAKLNQDLSKE